MAVVFFQTSSDLNNSLGTTSIHGWMDGWNLNSEHGCKH